MKHVLHRLLPLLMLIGAVMLRAEDPAFLSDMRLRVFDVFQRLSPRTYAATPVRVVDIDEESLRRYGQWPWPRSRIAAMIERLQVAGASVVAFDMVFAEADRTAPRRALPEWGIEPSDPVFADIVGRTADPDAALAAAIAQMPVVLGFVLTSNPTEQDMPRRKGGLAVQGAPKGLKLGDYVSPRFTGAVVNLPDLLRPAQGLGSINVIPQNDGIVRQLPLLLNGDGTLYPSLVVEALRVAEKASTLAVKSSGASGYQHWWQELGARLAGAEVIAELRIGRRVVPTDGMGRVWLHDSGRIAQRQIPAWQILSGEVTDLTGAILFVGTSAPGLLDLRATPLNLVTPGVEIHAQIAEQILTGVSLQRPYWTILPELALLIILSITLVLLLPRLGPLGCTLLGAGTGLIAIGLAWLAFAHFGQLFDPVYPCLSTFAIFVTGVLTSYFRSDIERRGIREAFGHYLAPEMVERLADDPSQLRLGGELREVTIMFCDIRDFTSIAERTDATRLTRLLNSFLTPMTDAILRRHGTIDKYIGDSIMAFWNAPLDDPDHAEHACSAALDMRRSLAELNTQRAAEEPLRMGIGINSGTCLVGNLGTQKRFNYSVIGDDVNLASRLETLTKSYGIDILVADPGDRLAAKFALLPLGEVQVKGKQVFVRIMALVGGATLARDPRFKLVQTLLQEVIAALRIGDTRAARRFLAECPTIDEASELRPLYDHMALAIERLEGERGAN